LEESVGRTSLVTSAIEGTRVTCASSTLDEGDYDVIDFDEVDMERLDFDREGGSETNRYAESRGVLRIDSHKPNKVDSQFLHRVAVDLCARNSGLGVLFDGTIEKQQTLGFGIENNDAKG
jgi:hypothetical protein